MNDVSAHSNREMTYWQAWDAVEEMYSVQEGHVPGRLTRPAPRANPPSGESTP